VETKWNGWSSSGVPGSSWKGGGEEARRFARVLERAGELCPWVHPVRLGVGALPARGPPASSVERRRWWRAWPPSWTRRPPSAWPTGSSRHAGRPLGADRPSGGRRTSSVPGRWPPWPDPTWRHLAAAGVDHPGATRRPARGQHLGPLRGGRRRLPRGGPGESGELAGLRDRGIERRLRVARGEDPTGARCRTPALPARLFRWRLRGRQPGRPLLRRVQERLGIEAVVMGRLRGGRDPAGQSVLLPWGSPEVEAAVGAPWPGRVPRRHRPTCCGCRCAPRWPTPPAAPSR